MLLARGYDVHGLDSDLFADSAFLSPEALVATNKKDVREVESTDVEGFDAVIHLAGLSNDPMGDYRPEMTDEINHRASVKLARLARSAGVKRFIFASSCSNYGAAGDEFLAENAAFNPVTPYGQSKVDAEKGLAELADDQFSPVFLRASTAYGVSPKLRFDLVVNNLTAWAFTTQRVRLKSDGKPWRPLVHVEDIAMAYVAALQAPVRAVHNKAFNVGTTTENYRVRDVAELVSEIVPGSILAFAPDAGADKRNYRVDCNFIARSLPDFKPQWTVRKGILQLHEAFKNTDLTTSEFEGEKYKRIAHIKKLIREGRLDTSLRWTS